MVERCHPTSTYQSTERAPQQLTMYSNSVRARLKASLLASSSRRQLPSFAPCCPSTRASRHGRRRHRHHLQASSSSAPATAMPFSRGLSSAHPRKDGPSHDGNKNGYSNNSYSYSDANIPADEPFIPDPNMTLQQVHEARMAHLIS